jgi:hypothetical protein
MHRSSGEKKSSKSKRHLSLSGDVTVSAAVLAANDLMVSAPHPLCPIVCSRERSFVLIVIMLLVMIFTFHEMGRNSDLAWYPASMLSLSDAQSNQCVRTEGALATRPERSDAYWDSSVKALVELQGIAHDADAAARVEAAEALVVSVLRNCSNFCNVLVFGVSWDAILISEANWAGGATVFLEDDTKWETVVRKKVHCMESYVVHYQTRLRDWPLYEEPYNYKMLDMLLPYRVVSTPWDVIIVRGPAGEPQRLGAFDNPGRMQSLYTASHLARLYFRFPPRSDAVDVLVFDIDRMVENRFANRFLGADNIVGKAGDVAHFKLRRGFEKDFVVAE